MNKSHSALTVWGLAKVPIGGRCQQELDPALLGEVAQFSFLVVLVQWNDDSSRGYCPEVGGDEFEAVG